MNNTVVRQDLIVVRNLLNILQDISTVIISEDLVLRLASIDKIYPAFEAFATTFPRFPAEDAVFEVQLILYELIMNMHDRACSARQLSTLRMLLNRTLPWWGSICSHPQDTIALFNHLRRHHRQVSQYKADMEGGIRTNPALEPYMRYLQPDPAELPAPTAVIEALDKLLADKYEE